MIALKNLEGKTIAVMGLAKSGLATLAALKNSGARVLAWDDGEEARKKASAAGFAVEDLTNSDWTKINSLILSPGIPHTLPKPHAVAALAKQHGVEIIGDVELLFRHFQGKKAPRMVAVTGTNGKSTTTALIAHLLKSAGRSVEAGGNLGTPVLEFPEFSESGFYVIEMSSFQCELTPSANFNVVAWLNITPDHLDRHGDMQGYVKAKTLLLKNGNPHLVIGVDDEPSRDVATHYGTITPISAERMLEHGVSGVNGAIYIDGTKLISFAGAKALPGAHNAQNAAAAFAVCHAMGIDTVSIEQALLTYPGLPHRQQLTRTIGNVRFINDSKATNADASSKALSCYDAIYWILG
ncbi:MAG TPA: UDP-N-acetylmuramoyl-L-alanine--D-glutamate ligase, partial [Alphaproteobacteria bacterium]|nr:UDP-N-acetylmuramoyl-L-alanine--D-glutamate ligase [Alphaproteobacteria bacterium]